MRELVPPLFQILTGLAFFCVLAVGVFARPALRWVWGRLIAFSLVCSAAGFYFISAATGPGSASASGNMFIAGGAALTAGVLLITVGLFMAMRVAGDVR